MNTNLSKSMPRRAMLVGLITLITLAAFVLALYGRRLSELPSLTLPELTAFEFDPYVIGFALQELVIPVTLLYLFSNADLFQRIVSGQATSRDNLKLFGGLVVVQLLALNYSFGLLFVVGDQTASGLLVVMVGGLLGGWRMGLGLGLVTMFVRGTHELILYPEEELFMIYQVQGLRGFFSPGLWGDLFIWNYLFTPEASAAVWAGIVAGLCADLLGERRFMPAVALALGIGIELGAGYLTATSWEDPETLISYLLPAALVSGLALAVIVLIVRNVQARIVQREAEVAQLARAQAELRALRAQINPHFLFNALNTIRYSVRTDPKAARRLLLNLSQVFQRALRSGDFVSLQDELSYVEAYLSLEKARLDERLRVEWSLPNEGIDQSPLRDRPVPTLILQPIVENAVIHGIARKAEGGTLRLAVGQGGEDLLLSVEDDGPGISPERLAEVLAPIREDGAESSEGRVSIGLRNVDGRLRALYGEAHGLVIESQVGQGTRVQIRIPREE